MRPHDIDALIVTALYDELEAVLSLGDGGRAGWEDGRDPRGYPFHVRTFEREDGTPLRIAAATFDKMAEAAGIRATSLIEHLKPKCIAMCGICAGNKKDVVLGDVIVASLVYNYDHGKLVAKSKGEERVEEVYHDIETYNLKQTWRVDAAYFAREFELSEDLAKARPPQPLSQDRWILKAAYAHETAGAPPPHKHPDRGEQCPGWTGRVKALRERGLLKNEPGVLALTDKGRSEVLDDEILHPDGVKERPFAIHVGPVATGSKVMKDPELFDRLERFVRKTIGAEMEAATIGLVGEHSEIPAIVVKAVSDYGDGDKDDSFRKFATRASAEVLIRFLLRNLRPFEPEIEEDRDVRRERGEMRLFRGGFPGGDDLLSRVQRVCDLRVRAAGETPEIQRFRARPPFAGYLRVTVVNPGTYMRVHPVAAVERVTADVLDAFLTDIDARYRRDDPGVRSTLVYGGEPPPAEVAAKAAARGVLLQSFPEYQGLIDFRDYLKRQIDRLAKDPIYPPSLYVEQHAALGSDGAEVETTDALSELSKLLGSPLGRFVLVLGDFGAGKTFLLHELARRMALAGGPLVPVLIELRALEKAHDLNTLVAQHLTKAGMERIDLPAFRYMLSEGRIALLFDGFDELALRGHYDRATEHFDTLIEAAQGNAKVVITSRTQHFISDQQVKLVLAQRASEVQGYRLLKIRPFTEPQIRRFLENRLGSSEAAEARFRLLDEVKDLLGLSAVPRMLGFIADIAEEDLRAAKARERTITSAGLYKLLLDRWLEFEFNRAHPKGAPLGLDVKQRWKAVTEVALLLWRRTERAISELDLPAEILEAVKALATHDLDPGIIRHQTGAGTLLVRDEEGNFSFIHQSVMEWLVAQEVAEQLARDETAAALGVREISPLMADFVEALAGREAAEGWAQRVLNEGAVGVTNKNALLVLERLGVDARVGPKLAGQDLRGQNLAGKNLRYADLTGADLTGASLAGANLRGAKLADARLLGADLSNADLRNADLSRADMAFARLLGADLSRATLLGARLREAKLVGATIAPKALEGCDLFGAALPYGEKPAAMVSAASACYALTWSPDGQLLATGHDGSIRVWDVESRAERRVLKGHAGPIISLAFSPDGQSLASGSDDTTVRLWDVASGTERRVLKGHAQGVWGVAFSPDGQSLASGSSDATMRLWDIASGTERRVFKGHAQRVWSVAFSPDGQSLASGSSDTTVRLWDVASGTERRALQGHAQRVYSVAFSPNGQSLASGSDDTTVRLWDVASGTERRVLQGHAQSVQSVAFSPDGDSLASGSDDTTVRLWDVASGTERRVLQGHARSVWSVAFSPDGQSLASGSSDATVRLWDVASDAKRRVLQSHAPNVFTVAFSPDGQFLASGSSDTTIQLWDVASGTRRRVLQGHAQSVYSVAFSPDGPFLASGSDDTTVRLWDIASGTERCALLGHAQRVWSVAFSPDGQSLASGSSDTTVRLWDVASGTERRVLKGHAQRVWNVAFSPNSQFLASGSDDTTVRLWDVASGTERRVLKGHAQRVFSVAFSPDSQSLASGSDDRTVRLWGVASSTERRVLKGHAQSVWSVAFSPDGQSLASGSSDTTVRLWDVASGTERRALKGHAQRVYSVAFSPDGQMLASASTDGTVRLWNVPTGECFAILLSLPEGWVAFTPDGRYRSAGAIGGAFWHAIGLCRFEAGELDPYLPTPLRVPDGTPLYTLPR